MLNYQRVSKVDLVKILLRSNSRNDERAESGEKMSPGETTLIAPNDGA